MKMAKKLLAVAMVLSMIAAFTAIAFAANPSVAFAVGDYADGKATVAVSLVDCVDLTSGSLNFGYETGKVTKIVKKNGTDAKAIGDIDNAFNSEFNADTNPAEFGFYFKNKLWDNAAWAEAAEDLGQDDVVNGANFECAQFVFTAEAGAVITVTGELKFGDTAVAVNKTFTLGKGPDPVVETTTEKEPEPVVETTTEKEPEESICKAYLVKVEAKAATCTEAGNIAYYKCSVCGKTFSDADAKNEITNVTIKAKGHVWTEWTLTKVASSSDGKGSKTYYRTCTVCGAVEYDERGENCFYIGGDDGRGKTILAFDPLNGKAIVGYDKFGNAIYSENPLARRSVILDDSGAASSTPASSSSNNGTSSSAASSATGTKTSSSTSSVSASVKTDGGKKTGDNGVLAILAGVVALAGAAFVVTKKRK